MAYAGPRRHSHIGHHLDTVGGRRSSQVVNGYEYHQVPSRDTASANQSVNGPLQYDDPCGTAFEPNPVDGESYNAEVAAAKAMFILSKTATGTYTIEAGSVYGVALAIPQFARTAGFTLEYTGLVIRAYFFLISNIFLQGFLLYMLSKEERVMDKLGGKMHLCDFGAAFDECPDAPNCVGPGGTVYSATRLFNWEMWTTRMYVRDAFKSLFPDRIAEIHEKVDPGEYGLESYSLRIVCCFIFVMGCWNDWSSTYSIAMLLCSIPSKAEPWMSYEPPAWHSDKEHAKAMMGWTELELVKFKIAGMPMTWKVVNFIVLWFPKFFLWILTLDVGIVFLLETAVIEEMIINAVALAFILSLDELICNSLCSPVSLYMTEKLEPYSLVDLSEDEHMPEKDVYQKHQMEKVFGCFNGHLWSYIFPHRLIMICLCTSFFIIKYYFEHCARLEDGSVVSATIRLPASSRFSVLSFLFGPFPEMFPVEVETPSWVMPKLGD